MNSAQEHSYSRHILLEEIGSEGQQKLLDAKVAIVGLGGLGCPSALYLAASGVGTLHLIDADIVANSNLHRQTLFGQKDLGKSKVACAQQALEEKYPDQHFIAHRTELNVSNALELLKKATIILDCTDNFQARYLINDACIKLEKPFVYGALHKFEGQVAVFNDRNGPTYRCLFPEVPKGANMPNCSDVGVLGVVPGIIGTMQALETIKWIVGMDGILNRHLLSYHALLQETRKLKLPARDEVTYAHIQNNPLLCITTPACFMAPEVEWEFLENTREYLQIIDIREAHELPEGPPWKTHRIPASSFIENATSLNPKLQTALYCQSGKRSLELAKRLQVDHGFSHVVSVRGGINALQNIKSNYEKLF